MNSSHFFEQNTTYIRLKSIPDHIYVWLFKQHNSDYVNYIYVEKIPVDDLVIYLWKFPDTVFVCQYPDISKINTNLITNTIPPIAVDLFNDYQLHLHNQKTKRIFI